MVSPEMLQQRVIRVSLDSPDLQVCLVNLARTDFPELRVTLVCLALEGLDLREIREREETLE